MNSKIALGLNNGIDYEIVWDSSVIEKMVKEMGFKSSDIVKKSIISSDRDLLASILYHLRTGEGASAYVSDIKINFDFASKFKYKVTIGGAGTRASIAIDKMGYSSIVHLVSTNNETRTLLPPSVETFCSNDHDTLYPHLIIQFPEGVHIKANDIDITSPRANRIMYLHDPDIMSMPLSEEFFKKAADCKVLLIGGFTTLPNPADGLEKAKEVLGYIAKYKKSETSIYYEDSCPPSGISAGHMDIWRTVAKNISIFGLNEDELQNHIGRKINLLSAEEVTKALNELKELIPCKNYVLHTKYYALAFGESAQRYREPLLAGIALATTRLVHGDAYGKAEVLEIRARPADPKGNDFMEAMNSLDNGIVTLPSFLVTEKNVTTIGLGDAFVGGFLAKLSDQN